MNAFSPPRWTRDEAWDWYNTQPWIVGTNFIPSTACNTTEMWQAESFDADSMRRELGWAAGIGLNSIRVMLQYIVWKDDPAGMKARFNQLLEMAAGLGISVMPVLFDDCVFGWPRQLDPFLGKQREPVPGMILPSWTPSPGRLLGVDPGERPMLKQYVQDFIDSYRANASILGWDLFNEPLGETSTGTPEFLSNCFDWAREAGNAQPLTIGYYTNFEPNNKVLFEKSDLISFHGYMPLEKLKSRIDLLKGYGRPILCTEWMARPLGSQYATDLPMFLDKRVGCYQWGLVNGRTQGQYNWRDLPGAVPDPVHGWFHDIFHANGQPYRQDEIDAIKRMTGAS